ALVGMAFAGPIGAVAGAASGVAAQALADLAKAALNSRLRRAEETLETAAQITGYELTDLEEILLRDEGKLELAAQALDASATSSFSDRVVAFAAAIAIVAEVHDLEILQRIGIVVRALSSLDNLHVTLLASLVDTPRPAGTQPAELENEFNLSADELRPIVR